MISILLPNLRGGGAERVSIDLARALAALGHDVEFVLMRAIGDFLSEARREFSVVDLGVQNARAVPRPLARYLRARRPDALLANLWPLTSVAVLGRALSAQKCALLLIEHSTLSKQYAPLGSLHNLAMRVSMMAACRWADCVAAVSEGAALDAARIAGLPKSRVTVL